METVDLVREFHQAFGLVAPDHPAIPSDRVALLRLHLLQEELGELAEAMAARDMVGVLDALTDLQYVLDGTYVAYGLRRWKRAAFGEVHRSNMSKLDEQGRPVLSEAGRVVKGPLYEPPRLKEILEREP